MEGVTVCWFRQVCKRTSSGDQQIMNESHEKSSQDAHRADSTSVEAGEVLAAMEQTVEAAGALGAEIERAKEKLVAPPASDPD
jgi:hypothetical protein